MNNQEKLFYYTAQLIQKHGVYCEFSKTIIQEAKIYFPQTHKHYTKPVIGKSSNGKELWLTNHNGAIQQGQAEEKIIKGMIIDVQEVSSNLKNALSLFEIQTIIFNNKKYFLFTFENEKLKPVFKMALLDKHLHHPNKWINKYLLIKKDLIQALRGLKNHLVGGLICNLILYITIWVSNFRTEIKPFILFYHSETAITLNTINYILYVIDRHLYQLVRVINPTNSLLFLTSWLFFMFLLNFDFRKNYYVAKSKIF